MSGYSDANMLLAVFLVLGSLSTTLGKQLSLFQLAFQEAPKRVFTTDLLGATPADTFPLVIVPLSFVPAVVAPPSFLFPSPIRFPSIGAAHSTVRGAIPLFAPLKPFPYIRYLPVKTTFYLSEPNIRDPEHLEEDPVQLPFKHVAPKPAFSPIRDTQVIKRPSKISETQNGLSGAHPTADTPTRHIMLASQLMQHRDHEKIPVKHGSPKPAFSPVRDVQVVRIPPRLESSSKIMTPLKKDVKQDQHFVRVAHFPTELGGGDFGTRDENDLSFSAPAGIVQSSQPHFTLEPFSNAKLSLNLLDIKEIVTRTENEDPGNLPSVVEF